MVNFRWQKYKNNWIYKKETMFFHSFARNDKGGSYFYYLLPEGDSVWVWGQLTRKSFPVARVKAV